jgi:hypothetical protein
MTQHVDIEKRLGKDMEKEMPRHQAGAPFQGVRSEDDAASMAFSFARGSLGQRSLP